MIILERILEISILAGILLFLIVVLWARGPSDED